MLDKIITPFLYTVKGFILWQTLHWTVYLHPLLTFCSSDAWKLFIITFSQGSWNAERLFNCPRSHTSSRNQMPTCLTSAPMALTTVHAISPEWNTNLESKVREPWLGWLSCLGVVLCTERLPVWLPVRAHARGFSLSPFPFLPFSKLIKNI